LTVALEEERHRHARPQPLRRREPLLEDIEHPARDPRQVERPGGIEIEPVDLL